MRAAPKSKAERELRFGLTWRTVRNDLHYSTNVVVNVRLLCGGEESTAMWKGTVAIELKIVVKPLR